MNSQVFSSSSLFIFLFLVGIPLSLSNVNEILYESCATLFKCGNITDVDYPFWGGDQPRGCGYPGLELKCDKGVATIEFKSVKYRVLDIKPNDQILKIARADFLDKGICVSQFYNTTLDTTPFDYALGYEMKLTFFYGCPPSALFIPSKFSCPIKGVTYNDGYVVPEIFGALRPEGCHYSVDVPVLQKILVDFENSFSLLDEVFGEGFDVRWKVDSRTCIECQKMNGRCGSDYSSNQFTCICPNQPLGSERCTTSPADRSAAPQAALPPPGSSSGINISKKIAIGISGSVAGIIIIFIVMISSLKPDCLSGKAMNFWKKETKNEQKVEAFIRSYGSLAPNRYNFSDVKKMTKSFADKLGQGGYGGVYKGKLSDGHLVAVKVLSKSKGNGEEFINEVASISRTSHVNIVTLLGFCYERTKRALIYEFMPNGSLDKFIYDEGSSNTNRHLEWKTLYQIAVGIARGLEYLHRGCNTCNTRILHFDIKPHNVLLDEDFCPKISDFGLAKLCLRKESIISMQGTRGTAGYIAPELFSRNFGGVSHKSDVYSYGMMVLEMVGGRKNIDVGGSRTSEIYFPHWIHKNLELGEDLKLKGVMTEEEEETARKMILVGLWCIQTNPSNRPSISRAVEMLEGSLQSLQIPPKPFLSSPTRSPQHSSKTSSL